MIHMDEEESDLIEDLKTAIVSLLGGGASLALKLIETSDSLEQLLTDACKQHCNRSVAKLSLCLLVLLLDYWKTHMKGRDLPSSVLQYFAVSEDYLMLSPAPVSPSSGNLLRKFTDALHKQEKQRPKTFFSFIPNQKINNERRLYVVTRDDVKRIASSGGWDKLPDPHHCSIWIKLPHWFVDTRAQFDFILGSDSSKQIQVAPASDPKKLDKLPLLHALQSETPVESRNQIGMALGSNKPRDHVEALESPQGSVLPTTNKNFIAFTQLFEEDLPPKASISIKPPPTAASTSVGAKTPADVQATHQPVKQHSKEWNSGTTPTYHVEDSLFLKTTADNLRNPFGRNESGFANIQGRKFRPRTQNS